MRHRGAPFIISVVSGVLAVIALAVVLRSWYVLADINSPAGQQQIDGFGAAAWGLWTAIHNLAILALVVTGGTFLLVIYLRRPVIPPLPPPKS